MIDILDIVKSVYSNDDKITEAKMYDDGTICIGMKKTYNFYKFIDGTLIQYGADKHKEEGEFHNTKFKEIVRLSKIKIVNE